MNYIGFATWFSIGAAVLCIPYLRWKCPELERPIKVHLAFPIIYIIMTLVCKFNCISSIINLLFRPLQFCQWSSSQLKQLSDCAWYSRQFRSTISSSAGHQNQSFSTKSATEEQTVYKSCWWCCQPQNKIDIFTKISKEESFQCKTYNIL